MHGIWARRATKATAPWTCEFLLNEERNGEWVFRRNEAVRRPLEEVGDERDGVPFLRPEIALLYKSAEPSPKNDTDFSLVQAHLSHEARLLAALESCDDRHPLDRPAPCRQVVTLVDPFARRPNSRALVQSRLDDGPGRPLVVPSGK
jgi:hypothetical protein